MTATCRRGTVRRLRRGGLSARLSANRFGGVFLTTRAECDRGGGADDPTIRWISPSVFWWRGGDRQGASGAGAKSRPRFVVRRAGPMGRSGAGNPRHGRNSPLQHSTRNLRRRRGVDRQSVRAGRRRVRGVVERSTIAPRNGRNSRSGVRWIGRSEVQAGNTGAGRGLQSIDVSVDGDLNRIGWPSRGADGDSVRMDENNSFFSYSLRPADRVKLLALPAKSCRRRSKQMGRVVVSICYRSASTSDG